MPSGKTSLSENDEDGTTQRFSSSSQRRQCGDATLRIFVTLGSRFFPLRPSNGGRMPQRAVSSSRPPRIPMIGAKWSGKAPGQGWHIAESPRNACAKSRIA